jgi:hypothetical protein
MRNESYRASRVWKRPQKTVYPARSKVTVSVTNNRKDETIAKLNKNIEVHYFSLSLSVSVSLSLSLPPLSPPLPWKLMDNTSCLAKLFDPSELTKLNRRHSRVTRKIAQVLEDLLLPVTQP